MAGIVVFGPEITLSNKAKGYFQTLPVRPHARA